MNLPLTETFRALLLEDNPLNKEIFNGYLALLGGVPAHVVETLAEAEEQREAMLGGDFDLVVFDVMLPDGESLDLARGLAGKLPCPMAAYTARATPMEIRTLGTAGFDHVFRKPMPMEQFRQGIQTLIS